MPAALAHVVCCGGILILTLIGTASLATVTGFLLHPMVQFVGVVILAVGISVLWRRIKRKTQLLPLDDQSAANDAANGAQPTML